MNHTSPSADTLARYRDRTASASEIIECWRRGEEPDAGDVLSKNPSLQDNKSFILDLAYEEYCIRCESGEEISPKSFCDKFPAFRRSLQRLLEVHHYLKPSGLDSPSAERPRWPEPGEHLLGFTIMEELGRGAISRVFLARQPELGNRWVVLKLSFGGARRLRSWGASPTAILCPFFPCKRFQRLGSSRFACRILAQQHFVTCLIGFSLAVFAILLRA